MKNEKLNPWLDLNDPYPDPSNHSLIFIFLRFSVCFYKSLEVLNSFSFAVWHSEIPLAVSDLTLAFSEYGVKNRLGGKISFSK